MGVQAIVFDLDDTLYPEHDYVHSGFRAVGEWAAARWGISAFYETAAELFEQGVRGSVFNAALERLGVAYAEEEVAAMLAFYRGHRPAIALFADAAWALERFGGEYPLGLITDGYLETQRRKLEALGIAGRFQALVLSDELGREHWKPSAKPYETAAAKLGVAAEACVYVGDNPRKDFVTARRLGWRTVRIVRAAAASADTGAELGPDGRRTALTKRKEPRTATGTRTPRSGEYARVESLGAEYEAETTIGSLYELEELLERWKQK